MLLKFWVFDNICQHITWLFCLESSNKGNRYKCILLSLLVMLLFCLNSTGLSVFGGVRFVVVRGNTPTSLAYVLVFAASVGVTHPPEPLLTWEYLYTCRTRRGRDGYWLLVCFAVVHRTIIHCQKLTTHFFSYNMLSPTHIIPLLKNLPWKHSFVSYQLLHTGRSWTTA